MDVPFSSSGAISRAHYSLVRKIETATPQAADQILLAEVHSIRLQLTRSTLTMKQCKECLILLLYCSMAVNFGVHVDIQFALPHAINLAEAGQTTQDKRTGYLFCAEVMPPGHELQLMLVNSIRKDLESSAVPRICLALDTLMHSPSNDVIPAVQSRLHSLLSHNSLHVRRRALFALRSLSELEPGLFREVVNRAQRLLNDPDSVVVNAALTFADALLKANHLSVDGLHAMVTGLLDVTWSSHRPHSRYNHSLVKLMQVITHLTPSLQDLEVIVDIVRHHAHREPPSYAIIHQCLCAISTSPVETLVEVQRNSGVSFVQETRHLLTSHDPNAVYIFITSLSTIDPKLWAGTSPDIPAVLEEWDVECVMKLLDSDDRCIRKQTLKTLWRVDQTIVESYFARALQGDIPSTSQGSEDHLPRLLEILDITCHDDGETFGHQLVNILRVSEGSGPIKRRTVLQEAVEEIVLRVHDAIASWRSSFIGVMISFVADMDQEIGPTLMVILNAILCEYLELSPISPLELLRGISGRLTLYSGSVQDACLVTMLRIAASTDEIPTEVTATVNDLHSHSGRHIKRRCEQFASLSRSKDSLMRIIASAHTTSLPDFVFALERHEAEQKRVIPPSPSILPSSPPLKPYTPEPASSRASPILGKLRYAAYEAPKHTPRLRRGSSSSSRHSDDGSMHGWPDLARTVTPGDLTIAAQTSDLRSIPSTSPKQGALSPLPIVQILDEEPMVPTDLIALDSPFMSEPAVPSLSRTLSSIMKEDFEKT